MFATLMGLKTISPAALQQQLQAPGPPFVIDVNSAQSWAKAHVPGAVNASAAEFTEKELPADRNAALVFYCSNPMCRKAPTAARRAGKMGYTNVRVLSAGISGWLAAGLATEAGTESMR